MANYPIDVEVYLKDQVRAGQFRSRHDVIVAALRLARDIETRKASLKADILAEIDECECGMSEPLDIEALKAELETEGDSEGNPR